MKIERKKKTPTRRTSSLIISVLSIWLGGLWAKAQTEEANSLGYFYSISMTNMSSDPPLRPLR